LPSALQPNFVADKSSQIWSEVASIKSQSYVNQPSPMDEKQIHKQQHEELIRQINTRGQAVLEERQSEASYKSFAQIS
jgi:malate/lactate dehydrogenase